MAPRNDESASLDELRAIKRLVALLALKLGATQEEVAVALNVDRSRVSRMLPGIRPTKRD